MSGMDEATARLFEESLRAAGLGRWFTALNGGDGAIRLQHVHRLKQAARLGSAALDAALAESGVRSPGDRERLGVFLRQALASGGGLVRKPALTREAPSWTLAWRDAAVDERGELPGELSAAAPGQPEEDALGARREPVSAAEGWPAGMRVVNARQAHSIREQGMIQPPNSYGYVHLAGEVERPHLLPGRGAAKTALLTALGEAARTLRAAEPVDVRRADVFDAFLVPPGSREGRRVLERTGLDVHVAEFDVVVLVECATPEAALRVRRSAAFAELEALLASEAQFVHCVVANNAKRIAEVSKETDGVFLFNYFFAADIEAKGSAGIDVLLGVWEYTAGWWTAKANLTNSTPLRPLPGEPSEYSLINHCRWDRAVDVLPHLVFRPSLDSFVLANFTANDIVAMPVLYHLA